MAISRFKRVLIANRGEIAVRVIRALKELGMQSVAVYSDADENSMHVRLADFAVRLPGRLSADTYLKIPALVAAAKAAGADAIHPGYGFLSENADFAESVGAAGIKFIGPNPEAMRLMGDKIAAKTLMRQHNVPVTPGSDHPLESAEELKKLAREIGYPLILKAAAGGGGRGMRVVRRDEDLAESLAACQREAQAWFGNPAVFCERYIERPRHIEIQVLFDEHGNGVHLWERDCSVQRRHQKLVEEAPSPYLSQAQREQLGATAVKAAKAAGYWNAGTIEFICESPEKIYFMEMNTRIQVEHPVSETITGVDLIRQQILVACGEPLPFLQKDIPLRGCAIELRINAEDPAKGFAPAPGRVSQLIFPAGPDIRVDSHMYPGYTIPSEYDSMVAKLIVRGANRSEVLARIRRALGEMLVEGVPTTAKFHEALLDHPDFIKGNVTTKFLEEQTDWFENRYRSGGGDTKESTMNEASCDAAAVLAAIAFAEASGKAKGEPGIVSHTPRGRWADAARFDGIRR
jgi:acetyl-CoA carboxylase biotin carboxylase subunit